MNKLLIFHPALAPYLVDQFNSLSQLYDLEVVFVFDNVWNHKFDQSKLISQLQFKVSYLLKGPRIMGRVFRFGILKTIKRINPDVIMGYEYSFITQYLILLKRFGFINQKIGSLIDDSIDICNHVQSKIRYIARKQTVNHLDYLVLLTDEVSQYYQNKFNINSQQIIVSPMLQNPVRLRSNKEELECIGQEYVKKYNLQGKKVLLFVGRFIPEKSLMHFINTTHDLLLNQEDLVLVLVGDGEERHKIEILVKETQLDNKVLLPGRYEGTNLYAWYLCASGFVLPSLYEPFGAVVNEALIFGLNVFCSKYAGASSLIQSDKGLIFDPLNKELTNEKLKKFLTSIDAIRNVDMNKRPSKMPDYQHNFIEEWRKMK